MCADLGPCPHCLSSFRAVSPTVLRLCAINVAGTCVCDVATDGSEQSGIFQDLVDDAAFATPRRPQTLGFTNDQLGQPYGLSAIGPKVDSSAAYRTLSASLSRWRRPLRVIPTLYTHQAQTWSCRHSRSPSSASPRGRRSDSTKSSSGGASSAEVVPNLARKETT